MTYDYRETSDEIIIDKGISTRQMWKEYEHGQEYVSFEELEKAAKYRPTVPLVLETEHQTPLRDTSKAIGTATFTPCPEKKGLSTTWRFYKSRIPDWLLLAIRQKREIPVSTYQFIREARGEQKDLLFDHVAILNENDPRCPIERCGIGVYDMTEETKTPPPMPKEEGPSVKEEPVSLGKEGKEAGKISETIAEKPPETLPAEEATESAVQVEEATQIEALKAELQKEKEKVAAIRGPIVEELTNYGFEAARLNPLDLPTLNLMLSQARQARTQGLPGTAPRPAPKPPKSIAEQREEVAEKAKKDSQKRQADKWKDW